MHSVGRLIQSVEWILGVGGGGGYRIHLSYRWVVEEVIHSVKEVIQLI